jgi:hypothetical protein
MILIKGKCYAGLGLKRTVSEQGIGCLKGSVVFGVPAVLNVDCDEPAGHVGTQEKSDV